MKHKFHAKPTTYDDIRFASKKEAKRYHDLKRLKDAGEVLFFLRQTPFHLPGNIRYTNDFTVFWANGEITFEDCKGVKTEAYVVRKKLVEATYPIEIKEI